MSTLDNNFQICKFNYQDRTMAQCNFYNLDYGLDDNQSLSEEKIHFQMFVSNDESMTFIFNFQRSQLASLQNRFFIISSNGNSSIEIPIKNFVIDKINIMSKNLIKNNMQLLMTNVNNGMIDMITFRMEKNIIEKKSLENGLIRKGITGFGMNQNVLVIFDINHVTKMLMITQIDLNNMNKKHYEIPSVSKILKRKFSKGFIVLIVENKQGLFVTYFVNTITGKYFTSPKNFHYMYSDFSILDYENNNYLWVYLFLSNDPSKRQFLMCHLKDFDNIEISFDSKILKNNELKKKYALDNNLENFRSSVKILFKNQIISFLQINFLEFDYIYSDINMPELKARIKDTSSYYLLVKGNNLDIDEHNKSVLYFNVFGENASSLKEDLKDEEIFAVFGKTQIMFITRSSQFFMYNFKQESLDDSFNLKKVKFKKIKGLSDSILKYSDSVEIKFIFEKYAILLVNQRDLYYGDIKSDILSSDYIQFQQFEFKSYNNCKLNDIYVYCDNNSSKRIIQIYKFQIIDEEINLVEIEIDFLSQIVLYNSNSFFFSKYLNNKMFALVVLDHLVGIQFINYQNNKKFINIPSLDVNDIKLVEFKEWFFNCSLVFVYNSVDDFSITGVCSESLYHYPIQQYLINFKDSIGIFLTNGIPFFAYLYRTLDNKIRAIVYKRSVNVFERVIKNTEIDKDECQSSDIYIDFYLVKTSIFFFYFCKSSKNSKIFKIIEEIYLKLDNSTSKYDISFAKNQKHQFIQVKEPEIEEFPKINNYDIFLRSEASNMSEFYDLEAHNSLTIEGNIVSTELKGNNNFLEFKPRIKLLNLRQIIHENKMIKNKNMKILNMKDKEEYAIISNEYIIKRASIQNNNFFEDCSKPKILTTDKSDSTFTMKDLFICRSIEDQNFYITDFLSLKILVKSSYNQYHMLYLFKKDNYLYLICKRKLINSIFLYKFLVRTSPEINLTSLSMNTVDCKLYDRFLHSLETYHLKYVSKTDDLLFFIKNKNSSELFIVSFNLKDNFINYSQYITLKISEESLYSMTNCSDRDESIICFGMFYHSVAVIEIYNDTKWRIKILYEVPTYYKTDFLRKNILHYIDDKYIALINNFKSKKKVDQFNAMVSVYKLDPETKSGNLFYSLSHESFELENEDEKEQLTLCDLKMIENKNSSIDLIILGKTMTRTQEKHFGFEYKINIFQFSINNFEINYNIDNLNYRDNFSVLFYFNNGQSLEKKFKVIIFKNAKVYIYIIINLILFCILMILCCSTYCIYRSRKLKQMQELDEHSDGSFEDHLNETSKSFAI